MDAGPRSECHCDQFNQANMPPATAFRYHRQAGYPGVPDHSFRDLMSTETVRRMGFVAFMSLTKSWAKAFLVHGDSPDIIESQQAFFDYLQAERKRHDMGLMLDRMFEEFCDDLKCITLTTFRLGHYLQRMVDDRNIADEARQPISSRRDKANALACLGTIIH